MKKLLFIGLFSAASCSAQLSTNLNWLSNQERLGVFWYYQQCTNVPSVTSATNASGVVSFQTNTPPPFLSFVTNLAQEIVKRVFADYYRQMTQERASRPSVSEITKTAAQADDALLEQMRVAVRRFTETNIITQP